MTSEVLRANYSGQLLRMKSEEPFPEVAHRLHDVTQRAAVTANGWHLFSWATEFDAGIDAREISQDDGKFVYPLLLREVGERFLLASTHSDVVQQFVQRNKLARLVERPLIDVAGLVSISVFPAEADTQPNATVYRMGALYAAVDGFGRSVRTISLFGDDLGSAGVVRDILKYLNPFRVSLREARSDHEVLSISTQGEISFYFRGNTSLEEVDRALAYIRRGNFIHWRIKQ